MKYLKYPRASEHIMHKTLIASLLVAVSAAFAAPAFASSGYGPAPSYNPQVGAPSSQRGQSAQTIAAENAANNPDARAYGGGRSTTTQSVKRDQANSTRSLFSHNGSTWKLKTWQQADARQTQVRRASVFVELKNLV